MREGTTLTIDQFLEAQVKLGGSDLWLSAGNEPRMRINRKVVSLPALSDLPYDFSFYFGKEDVYELLKNEIPPEKREDLEQRGSVDFAVKKYIDGRIHRFRACLSRQVHGYVATFRWLKPLPEDFSKLNIPEQIVKLAYKPRGMILVTGPTGSGKTTTLAAIIQTINRNLPYHIITLEDPIEFEFPSEKSLITQKAVGEDIPSFAAGLRAALRENPNVILVGEMRNLETMRLAIEAAATGHLVLATVHTKSAYETVYRILNVFPPEEQGLVRDMLADNLVAVVAQVIMPRIDRDGVAVAFEFFRQTPAVVNSIKKGDLRAIKNEIQDKARTGEMLYLEFELVKLADQGVISVRDAIRNAPEVEELMAALQFLKVSPETKRSFEKELREMGYVKGLKKAFM